MATKMLAITRMSVMPGFLIYLAIEIVAKLHGYRLPIAKLGDRTVLSRNGCQLLTSSVHPPQ